MVFCLGFESFLFSTSFCYYFFAIVFFGFVLGIRRPLRVLYLLAQLVDLFAKKAPLELFLYAQSPHGFESFLFSTSFYYYFFAIVFFGGVRGIRTLARFAPPTDFESAPL